MAKATKKKPRAAKTTAEQPKEPHYIFITLAEVSRWNTESDSFHDEKVSEARELADMEQRPVQICVMRREMLAQVHPTTKE